MAIKKLLTGQNFCKCPPCEEIKQIIYPYTLFSTTFIDDTSNTNLYDWLFKDKIKLNSISSGAQQNVIEKISVNGTEIRPESKTVNIESYVLMNSEDLYKFFEEIPEEGVYEARIEGYYLVNIELVKKE